MVSSLRHRLLGASRRGGNHAASTGAPSRNQAEADAKTAETARFSATGGSLAVGGATLDLAAGRVRSPHGTETELRVQSAEVLRALAARRGETVTKEELHAAVWGGIAVTEDSLVQCIGDIRRALGDARDRVQTIRGRGYRLADDDLDERAPFRRRALAAIAGATLLAVAGVILLLSLLRDGKPDMAPLVAAHGGPVVAVLPFENLAGGDRWDRLARGLTEEMISDLAQSDWIFVFADATSRTHARAAPSEVRATLGVDYLITGSVLAEGDRVRIAAALADAASGRQLWSRRWVGAPDDLLALQADASEALTGELAGHYSGAIALADQARAHRASTTSLGAYDLYLLGIEHKHRMTPHDFELAQDYLLRSVAIDPDFAKAWVGLSIVMGFMMNYADDEEAVAELQHRMRDYTTRAIHADPDDPATLLEAGRLASMDGDFAAAARAIRRAVERAPNDADILAVAAWMGPGNAGIYSDADVWADRALVLNPAAPGWYLLAKGNAAFAAGDYEAAIAALQVAPPDFAERPFFLAAAHAMLGNTGAAHAAAEELRAMIPDFDLDLFLRTWPDPGLRRRMREGAIRAGLGEPLVGE